MRKTMLFLIVSALYAPVVAGCDKQASEPAPAGPVVPPPSDPAKVAPAPATGAASAAATNANSASSVKGVVLERIDASSYSYLRLKTERGEEWAAVPKATVSKGAEVTITNPMVMKDFEGKAIGRKFDRIYFGELGGGGASAMAAAHAAAGVGGAGTGAGAGVGAIPGHKAGTVAAADAGVKVTKAEGPDARTVAEVWASKDALGGKDVTVRGKVVKYTPRVMGKNWIHIQDGTGSAGDATHDLAVTTTGQAAEGDIVTIHGKVSLHKDFGAGYVYDLLVEDASLTK